MKRLILAMILLGTAGCTGDPANAIVDGYEASYSKDGRADAITVSLADDGNARLWAGKRRGIVTRDGLDYLMNERRVAIDRLKYRMEPVAALRTDVMAMLTDLARVARRRAADAAGKGGAAPVREVRLPDGRVIRFDPPPVIDFRVELIGTEEVGGRQGKVWRLSAVGETRPNGLEAVMSSDRELAPVGRLVRMHMAPTDFAALEPEGTSGNLARAAAELFGKGTLLRLSARGEAGQMQELFRLERFERSKFRGAVFALPATVLDRKKLRGNLDVLSPVEEDAPMKMI